MGDWADERAAEWFGSITPAIPAEIRGRFVTLNMPSLAALLREVREQPKPGEITCPTCGTLTIMAAGQYHDDLLAEVRRVVEEVKVGWLNNTGVSPPPDDVSATCDEILSRLDNL